MAKKKKASKARAAPAARTPLRPGRLLARWLLRVTLAIFALLMLGVSFYAVFDPPTTPYMVIEENRLGAIDHAWIPMEEIAPVMARAAVAAEDANFCNHWGFDMAAIRLALESGGQRGASTISQQTVKNVYLWQGRSWMRKALEAVITPVVEAVWPKRRILEVYLNVAEFGTGVFGIEAASYHYFKTTPAKLTDRQAAQLAVVLPDPKERSASQPTDYLRKRAAAVRDGAATILADGRAACFES